MTTRKLIAIHIASALGMSAMLPAYAADDANKDEDVERLEVIGSHIKRADIEGSSPVLSINRDEIDRKGYQNLGQILEKLPSTGNGTFSTQGNNQDSSANGAAGVSLRGLGADATLVLINGRRMAISSFAQNITTNFVDINSIPVAAIERIEVLKDGASATYGSDAVAGVVNVVLRKDFTGTEINVGYGNTTDTDASEQTMSALWGFADDKNNATLILDYFKNAALLNKDRDFADSADQRDRGGDDYRSSTGFPGAFRLQTGVDAQGNPVYGPEQFDPACPQASRRGTRCAYDYAPSNNLLPAAERLGMTFLGTHRFDNGVEAFTEVAIQHNNSEARGAPAPGTPPDNMVVPASSPANPYGVNVRLNRYRVVDAGPRRFDIATENSRVLAGLRGTFGDGWDWEGAFYRMHSKSDQSGDKGWVRVDKLKEALADGRVNPFGGAHIAPDVLEDITTSVTRIGESRSTNADFKLSGQLAELPAGPLMMGVGAEYQSEDVSDRPDRQFADFQILGTEAVSASADRTRKSGFVELIVPMLEGFEVQLAGRYDNYNDFGSTFNPKVALRWTVNDAVTLRGSWGEGFRAPSLAQIGLGPSEESPALPDPYRCAQTNDPGDCDAFERSVLFRGNKDLDPETSESWNAGMVWDFTDSFSATLDVWNIRQDDKIDKVPLFTAAGTGVYDENCNNQASSICQRDTPATPGQLGELLRINNSFFNTGYQEAGGIDVGANYRMDLGSMGNLRLDMNVSYLDKFERQLYAGAPVDSLEGEFNYPEYRWQANADWTIGDWDVAGSINYIGEFEDAVVDDDGNVLWDRKGRTVDSFVTYNAQVNYNGIENTRLTFGVDNLTDEEPPFFNGEGDHYVYGYASDVHNPRGRFVYGKVSYRF
ncbi:MAG: TonB-dependent receptor [Gammaproteobacteria bacterium]|nr:TonB-dependent receptor [Gammaproteobacteria bacterium]